MILHRPPKFIFVHIPKTGGTSIECALVKHFTGRRVDQLRRERAARLMVPARKSVLQHTKLAGYAERFGIDLGDYFTFTFVRNPWDLVISEICYFRAHEKRTFNRGSVSDNIPRLVSRGRPLWGHDFGSQLRWIRDADGRVDMDYIGRFENLAEDFAEVCGRLGIGQIPLPHKLNVGRGRPHYSTFYDRHTRDLVAEHFAEDIEYFGYEFADPPGCATAN